MAVWRARDGEHHRGEHAQAPRHARRIKRRERGEDVTVVGTGVAAIFVAVIGTGDNEDRRHDGQTKQQHLLALHCFSGNANGIWGMRERS